MNLGSGWHFVIFTFLPLHDYLLTWSNVVPIKHCFLLYSPGNFGDDRLHLSTKIHRVNMNRNLPFLTLTTKRSYLTVLTFKVFFICENHSVYVLYVLPSLQHFIHWRNEIFFQQMKITFWLNIIPYAVTHKYNVFSENDYRCVSRIDKKTEHLNVLGKTDGIFLLGKTQNKIYLIDDKTLEVSQIMYSFLCSFFL